MHDDTVKSLEEEYANLMVVSGYYLDTAKWNPRWLKRGRITMQRFKNRNKSILEHIAETKAKDATYHRGDTLAFPQAPPEKLGVDLELRCVNDVVNSLVDTTTPDGQIVAEGTRRDIYALADRLVSLAILPDQPVHPEVHATAVMAACYQYNEYMCFSEWMRRKVGRLLEQVRIASKLTDQKITTLATMTKCHRNTLEEAARKFRFGKVS
jgi:hypothetical protein